VVANAGPAEVTLIHESGWNASELFASFGHPLLVGREPLLITGLPPGLWSASVGGVQQLVTIEAGSSQQVEFGGGSP
jgi:hypothetical protein